MRKIFLLILAFSGTNSFAEKYPHCVQGFSKLPCFQLVMESAYDYSNFMVRHGDLGGLARYKGTHNLPDMKAYSPNSLTRSIVFKVDDNGIPKKIQFESIIGFYKRSDGSTFPGYWMQVQSENNYNGSNDDFYELKEKPMWLSLEEQMYDALINKDEKKAADFLRQIENLE